MKHPPKGQLPQWIIQQITRCRTKDCLVWPFSRNNHGYGVMTIKNKREYAHRFAFKLNARINGKQVLHRCDNPACFNPSHLFLGTPKINVHDAMEKGRFICGEKVGSAKLNGAQVREIKKELKDGLPRRRIAAHFHISRQTVNDIAWNRTWKHL